MPLPPIIGVILLGLAWLFFAYKLAISLVRREVRTNNGTFRPNEEPAFYWAWIGMMVFIVFVMPPIFFLMSIGALR